MSDSSLIERTDLRLTSSEGLPIRATIVRPGRPNGLVIVIHGFKGFREWGFFPWLCDRLAAQGLAACRFDMSRNGIGESPDTFERLDLFEDDTYSTQLSDLDTVNRHLDAGEMRELPRFFLGHSRGGAVAILGAAARADLCGVVTWSSTFNTDRWDAETVKRWRQDGGIDMVNSRTHQVMRMSTAILDDLEANRARLNVERALRRLRAPLLAVHGENDESVDPGESRAIVRAARDASLVLIASGSHTFGAIHPLVDVPLPLQLAFEVSQRFISAHARSAMRPQ
jgi:dienelactone hydrolase